jgi:hypothetical protein
MHNLFRITSKFLLSRVRKRNEFQKIKNTEYIIYYIAEHKIGCIIVQLSRIQYTAEHFEQNKNCRVHYTSFMHFCTSVFCIFCIPAFSATISAI